MLGTPFLTKLDSRAAVKGSRDPLGVQPIWSRLGRQVVGNLTTVSSSVRDFTVLLLGYYFIELAAERGSEEGDLATFLKWEQLCGYARSLASKADRFRGVERVERRLREGEPVRLSVEADAQILGDQKIYGLWGLYTVPAKASGLLAGDPTRLTPEAREFVEWRLVPQLKSWRPRAIEALVDCLMAREYRLDVARRDAAMLERLAVTLATSAAEAPFYWEHLVCGGAGDQDAVRGTRGRQRLFAELLRATLDLEDWRPSAGSLRALGARAEQLGGAGPELAVRLERICGAELVLAPAVALFEYVLGCGGQSRAEIAASLRQHWGEQLRKTISPGAMEELWHAMPTLSEDADTGRRWCQLAAALHGLQFEEAIRLVLEQNAAVMKARSSFAPWAMEQEGRIQVKFRDQQLGRLPSGEELPELWRHAYFIEALRNVAGELGAAA